MSHKRQSFAGFAVVALAMAIHAQTVEPAPQKLNLAATNTLPSLPAPPVRQSPVDFFRRLLMMSGVERHQALADRPPEVRARIMAKLREYEALGPDECELRLRATELRWYLMPLLKLPPDSREASLEMVPADLRELAKSRLTQWDLLPPDLQQEFLANDKTRSYFALAASPAATNAPEQKIAGQFQQFLDFTPAEQDKLLRTLSETERAKMEATLKTFHELPPEQRFQCQRNFAKFAGMSGPDRAEFLKNAESWAQMSPEERQTWRDLVAHVPLWPPLPSIIPPMPPHIVPKKSSMATN
jgi:hypothetical protein